MKVLLTNCTRNAGIIIARALARAGHDVIGADDARMPFGLRSRHIRVQHVVPHEDDPAFVDSLLEIVAHERVEVLLPFSGVEAVAARREELTAVARFLAPSTAALAQVADKAVLPALCAEFGIAAPKVYTREEAVDLLQQAQLSLVVKPRRGRGAGGGIRFVQTAQELDAAITSIEGGSDAVIAECIPGDTDNERALHLLCDRESRLIASFSLRKTAQSPPRVGITAAAVSTHDRELVERVAPLLETLRWQGPLDVEWKLDLRDGLMKLIEINPRFSGAIGFPIALGVDMPALYVAAAAGAHLPDAWPSTYADGAHYLNPAPYIHALPARLRAGGLGPTLRRIRSEISLNVVVPAWELSDPAPLVGKLLRAMRTPAATR